MATDPARRPPTIDAAAARRWERRPPEPRSPWLHEEVGRRMDERLQWIRRTPRHWVDWHPLTGGLEAHARVRQRYPQAKCHLIEPEAARREAVRQALRPAWWRADRWTGSRDSFDPPPDEGVDLVWANMALHASADPEALIAQWHRLVATDGFLMFSCLGPDTLAELRAVYAALGWPPPSHSFTDMHDWGDMLVHAGFAEPVMDMERVVLTWRDADAALAELRGLGRNLHPARAAGLRGRGWRERLAQALAESAAAPPEEGQPPGRIAFTFEIVYGHAFKPTPRVAVAPQSAIELRDMREMLRRGRSG